MVPEISQIVPESLKVVPQPLIALTGKQTTSSSKEAGSSHIDLACGSDAAAGILQHFKSSLFTLLAARMSWFSVPFCGYSCECCPKSYFRRPSLRQYAALGA